MKKYIIPIFTLIVASCSSENSTVGVVDLPSLYASFDYQKELNDQFLLVEESVKNEKDSLNKAIQTIELSLAQSPEYSEVDRSVLFDRAYTNYLSEQEYLDYYKDSIATDFSTKVWKQLNSYVEEYGAENDYDVIIGMQGNGNVMYAKEGVNITDDVIVYANNKYNGK